MLSQQSIESPTFVLPGDGSHGGPNRGAEQDFSDRTDLRRTPYHFKSILVDNSIELVS